MPIVWLTFGALGVGMVIIGFSQKDPRLSTGGGIIIALVITSMLNKMRGSNDTD
jgi:hypothetical protein